MSYNPLVPPKFRAFDDNGDPLVGGKLYTYSAETDDFIATYTGSTTGSVANTNPVILDANGEADVWTTPGVNYNFALYDANDVLKWSVDNYPSPAAVGSSVDAGAEPGGRLTLTSATPVTTADVTGATTVYYAPYKSDKVPLYDGTSWTLHTISSQLSQATSDATKSPSATVGGGIYDIFVWSDSGTLRATRGPAWTTTTGRGTGAGTSELEVINGRNVNKVSISNGPAAQRGLYVGSVFSIVATNQLEDSLANRYVWNAYNHVRRPMKKLEATDTWTYALTAYRQANGSSANQINVLIGLSEDAVNVRLCAHVWVQSGDSASVTGGVVGIGLDSIATTVAAGRGLINGGATGLAGSDICVAYSGFPGIGLHYFSWMEKCNTAFTTRWLGDNGSDLSYGLTGDILA